MPTYWPTADLAAARADAWDQTSSAMVDEFKQQWAHLGQREQQPAARQATASPAGPGLDTSPVAQRLSLGDLQQQAQAPTAQAAPTAPVEAAPVPPRQPEPERPSLAASLPSLEDLTAGWRQAKPAPQPAGQDQQALTPLQPSGGAVGGTSESAPPQRLAANPGQMSTNPQQPVSRTDARTPGGAMTDEQWARVEAARLHIDPEKAVAVGNTEGGFTEPGRQNMQGAPAYSAYQLYIGGPSNPGLGDEALAAGIDPRDPKQSKQAITFALEHAARKGWGAFQGAAANGIGTWDGIGGTPGQQAQPGRGQTSGAASGPYNWQAVYGDNLTPDQFKQSAAEGLDPDTAAAICGPAAAVAFARANGRTPSIKEATDLAREMKVWDAGTGMYGPANEVALMKRMGVDATLEQGVDWDKVRDAVQRGVPVVLDTPGHYFVLQGYDPQTGAFNGGNSVKVLTAAQSNPWVRPQDFARLGMGAPRAAIYMNPGAGSGAGGNVQ